MKHEIDLAAVALPDPDMPPEYHLTNGRYCPVESVRSFDGSRDQIEGELDAYEAAYEEHLGDGFIEIQIIRWSCNELAHLDMWIADSGLDLVAHDSMPSTADAESGLSRRLETFGSGMTSQDSRFLFRSVNVQIDGYTVRALWHSEDLTVDDESVAILELAIRAAERFKQTLDGVYVADLDRSLSGLMPIFKPESNFENYLYRPERYDVTPSPAPGFVCGYRRGFTEQWVERGRPRRLIACDLLRFESADAAELAIRNPEGLVSEDRPETRFIPLDTHLHDAVLFAERMSSGFWTAIVFAAAGDLVMTVDVWGIASMGRAEQIASSVLLRVRDAATSGGLPVMLNVAFDS